MRSLILCLALLAPAAQAALVTYEYRGEEYDYFATENLSEDESFIFQNRWLNRTQNYVSGWITLDTDQLGGTIENVSYSGDWTDPSECESFTCGPTPLAAWSFFDGVEINGTPGYNTFFNGATIRFETDSEGNLSSWFLDFYGDPEALLVTSQYGDFRTEYPCTDVSGDVLCARSHVAGTWTKVSEPGALALLTTALCGILLGRRSGLRVRRLLL